MRLIDKIIYKRWNIGKPISEIMTNNDTEFEVKWVKHNFIDRFFADPFILNMNDTVIKVLVEEFPYDTKN